MVVPGALDDDGAVLLSHEIAREIEQELEYPGQIKVTVIRESRATDYARMTGFLSEPRMKRFHVTTFGCQMNEHDSERMKGMLESLGYAEAPAREDADLILFNTCSIREKADSRFVAHLHEAKVLKRRDPERVIGVGGCWAQSVKDQVFRQFPFVDVAFGPGQVHKLAEFLTSDSITAQGFFEFEGFTGHLPAKRARDFQGWVQISAGCNMVCSLLHRPVHARAARCRGRMDELVAEVAGLAADGVREVTLLGQNVNSYGRSLRPRSSFAELLYALDGIDGPGPHPLHEPAPVGHEGGRDPRARGAREPLRAHPPAAAGGLLGRAQADAPHLHARALPRPRRADPRARARTARSRPTSSSASRGRPRRTSPQTLEVAEEVGFDGAFTFIYSPRRGTEAAEFTDEFLPHEVSAERMERLVEVIQRRARERAQRFVGRTLDVLVEGTSRHDAGRVRGRTTHNKVVNFDGLASPGEIVPVTITGATSQSLDGRGVAASPAPPAEAAAVLPRRYLPVAVVTAVASYIVWSLARDANDFSGRGRDQRSSPRALFWLSLMALAAYAVQAGVDRHRDHD